VVPLYYTRDGHGFSAGWVKKSKASMKSILPHFNAQRMVMDYARKYYALARKQRLVMAGNDYARAREVAAWRQKLVTSWPKVRLRRLDTPPQTISADGMLHIRLAAYLDGLSPEDVLIECLIGTEAEDGSFIKHDAHIFTPTDGKNADGEIEFQLNLNPRLPGLQFYKVRMFPFHPSISHRFETGFMIWL